MGSATADCYRQLGTNKIKQKSTVGMKEGPVHNVLTVRDLALWSVSLCRLAYNYQCFRGACCFHFQGSSLFLEWMATCSNRRNLSVNVFLFVNSEDLCVFVCPIVPYFCVSVCPIFPHSFLSVCPIFPTLQMMSAEAHSNPGGAPSHPGRYRLPSNFWAPYSSVYCLLNFVSRASRL